MTVGSAPAAATVPNEANGRERFEFSRLIRAAGYVAVALALISAGVTYLVLVGLTPIDPTPGVVLMAMAINGGLIGFLIFVVAWELVRLLLARRQGRAAARLHIRIVILFCFIAAAPALLLAIVASVTLGRGLDNWFSTQTQAMVDNSLNIARSYAETQASQLRFDASAIKAQLQRAPELLTDDPARFQTLLTSLAAEHNLTQVFIVNSAAKLVTQADTADSRDVPPPVPAALEQVSARPDDVLVQPPQGNNALIGISQLRGFSDAYLYVARLLDPQVMGYLAVTNETVAEYRALEATRFGIQVAFGILFLGITVVVLLSAVWLGIGFANSLVAPIRRLIDAATEVSRGNLAVQVKPRSSDGDVGALGVSFNQMTAQLRSQRDALLAASEQIDSRRRFTEAVLSGATAGIAGLDADGRITIVNRTAVHLLGTPDAEAIGRPIADVLPQLGLVMATALHDMRVEHRDQITVPRGGRERTINVRVTTERAAGQVHGYVVTLDDITDLVSAQRSSAWADVARRIAHEIKNPLTPIQLSAERLKRRFGRAISADDRGVFEQCTDTIIRQVSDIGRMVDEFSSFARMPKPAMTEGNLSEAIREAVFLISVPHPEITFTVDVPKEPLLGRFDARLMGQALTNVVKNATEAIAALPPDQQRDGAIHVTALSTGDATVIEVTDNGIGFPKENRQRLLEPYMTTREKGTGLGLAIVQKIVEEHGGRVELVDAPTVAAGGHGAMIRIVLPRVAPQVEEAPEPAAPVEVLPVA